jgi:prenylcysteine oxidase/farnesylcysteine lyase
MIFLLVLYLNLYFVLIFLLYIAIIGSGIGGTSCAYFLKEIFNDFVEVDIYEGNKIGGRLATVTMNDGYEYETGGAVLHIRNKYMSDFVSDFGEFSETFFYFFISKYIYLKLGLKKRMELFNNQLLGIHNGINFDFVENSSEMINVIKMLWQYGYKVKHLQNFVDNMLEKFEKSEINN